MTIQGLLEVVKAQPSLLFWLTMPAVTILLGGRFLRKKAATHQSLSAPVKIIRFVAVALFVVDMVFDPWSAKNPLEVGQKELAALPSEKRIEIESRYHRIEQLFKDHEYGKVIEEADIILTDLPDGFVFTKELKTSASRKLASEPGASQTNAVSINK